MYGYVHGDSRDADLRLDDNKYASTLILAQLPAALTESLHMCTRIVNLGALGTTYSRHLVL